MNWVPVLSFCVEVAFWGVCQCSRLCICNWISDSAGWLQLGVYGYINLDTFACTFACRPT